MPITLTQILNQCGATQDDAPLRDIALSVLRDVLPALLDTLDAPADVYSETNPPPYAVRRGLILLCAADTLRRSVALPGSHEAQTVGGIQIGRSRLFELADTFAREGDLFLRTHRKSAPVIAASDVRKSAGTADYTADF